MQLNLSLYYDRIVKCSSQFDSIRCYNTIKIPDFSIPKTNKSLVFFFILFFFVNFAAA